MRRHRHYEIHCLLATCGELTEMELHDLQNHANECSDCADRIQQMCFVNGQLLAAHKVETLRYRIPRGSMERFAYRARREGVPIKSNAPHSRLRTDIRLSIACILVFLFVGVSFSALIRSSLNQSMVDRKQFHRDLGNEVVSNPSSYSSNPTFSVKASSSGPHNAPSLPRPNKRLRATGRKSQPTIPALRLRLVETAEAKASHVFDYESSGASRLDLRFSKPIGSLPELLRDAGAVSTIRPIRFRLNLDGKSACPVSEERKPNSDQHGFCFDPGIAFLTDYNSPHIPSFTWSSAMP